MRKKLTFLLVMSTAALSLAVGIGDLVGKTGIMCSTSACMKVHSSSFGTAFAIPVGFYATFFLLLSLWFYARNNEEVFSLILCSLLGLEAYFTFLQLFYIRSLCTTCLVFFALLTLCAVSAGVQRYRNAVLSGFMLFFVAHFAFFYPSVTLKPTLTLDDVSQEKAIEIFASPSCSHCEHAIAELRKLCAKTGTPLIVRPVSISTRDRDMTVRWVTGRLFQCQSRTSYHLAEKIVWENEKEARKLNGGKLEVPLILVKVDNSKELFKGWGGGVESTIISLLESTKNLGVFPVTKSYAATFDETRGSSICSGGSACVEDSN